MNEASSSLKIGISQMAAVWLDKPKTIEKISDYITEAAKQKCDLVVFSEALLPGYPHWLYLTKGSEFESKMQKQIHAHYIRQSVQIEKGDLDGICKLAKQLKIAIYLGMMERAQNRGGHSLYCSLAYINKNGMIKSVHRKLQPTYEERLAWAHGDGHGLVVHDLPPFTVGGLNCWENWMPLARTALYGQGENLHIAVWPGSERNTKDITGFIAKESRSFVVSASSYMTIDDIPKETPYYNEIVENAPQVLSDGGSCIASPNGDWLIPPVIGKEELICAELDFNRVLEERQNFDVCGHYSRPDVTKLTVNRKRQQIVDFDD
jgi:nitrilase